MRRDLFTKDRKLASRRGALFGASLWLQEDHVLSVHNMRFVEEYTRFYYKDILAIQVRRAPRLSCSIPLLLGIYALSLLLLAFLIRPPHYIGVLSAIALLGLLAYECYVTFFQSCFCHIDTAAGADQIPALFRLKATRQAVKRIATRVEAAQGELTAELLEAHEGVRSAFFRNSASERASTEQVLPAGRTQKGRVAAWLAILATLADGLITLMQSRTTVKVLDWLAPVNLLIVLAAGVTALILLRSSKQFRWLRNLAFTAALFVAGVSYTFHEVNRFNQIFNRRTRAAANLDSFNRVASGVNIGGDLCLVAVGAALALRRRPRVPEQSTITTLGGI